MRAPLLMLSVLVGVGCGHRPWENPVEQWKVVVSPHFVVRTDAPAGRYQRVIDHLEDVYEALSGTFFQGVRVPPIDVLLFAKQEDFEGVAPGNLLGFLTLRASSFEDGLLVLSADGEDMAAAEATAAHELAHRLLHAVNEKVPRWLHEGFAEYVAALEIRDRQVAFDSANVVPSWVYFEDPIPIDRLLTSGSGDFFGSDARAVYMTAWMLVRQLLANPRPGVVDRLQRLIAHSSIASTPTAAPPPSARPSAAPRSSTSSVACSPPTSQSCAATPSRSPAAPCLHLDPPEPAPLQGPPRRPLLHQAPLRRAPLPARRLSAAPPIPIGDGRGVG